MRFFNIYIPLYPQILGCLLGTTGVGLGLVLVGGLYGWAVIHARIPFWVTFDPLSHHPLVNISLSYLALTVNLIQPRVTWVKKEFLLSCLYQTGLWVDGIGIILLFRDEGESKSRWMAPVLGQVILNCRGTGGARQKPVWLPGFCYQMPWVSAITALKNGFITWKNQPNKYFPPQVAFS